MAGGGGGRRRIDDVHSPLTPTLPFLFEAQLALPLDVEYTSSLPIFQWLAWTCTHVCAGGLGVKWVDDAVNWVDDA